MTSLKSLLARKTYNVYFKEKGSGIKDMVVLNAQNQQDLRNTMKKKFKGWIIQRVEYHDGGDIMAVKSKYHQTGRSIKRIDRKIHAKKPGKRKSADGSVYYERRANRSDIRKWL